MPYCLPAPGQMMAFLDDCYTRPTAEVIAELDKVLADPLMIDDAAHLRTPQGRSTDSEHLRWHTALRRALGSLRNRRADLKAKERDV